MKNIVKKSFWKTVIPIIVFLLVLFFLFFYFFFISKDFVGLPRVFLGVYLAVMATLISFLAIAPFLLVK